MNDPLNKFQFHGPFALESGKFLNGFELAYETFGVLNSSADNAILICHGLTSDSHVARGEGGKNAKPGWWDAAVGPGKPFDTEKFFVLCSNVLGGCGGSTGPSSINHSSNSHYGLRFPVVTVRDMVNSQVLLADSLNIKKFQAVAGGCFGGFQVLEWMSRHPDRLKNAIVICATMRTSTHNLGLWEVIRQAIMRDPHFNGGDYYGEKQPVSGMGLAQMFGMMIWMDRKVMTERFGLKMIHENEPRFSLEPEFQFQAFLRRIAENAANRFDPNSLIYLTKATDYFDLTKGAKATSEIFRKGDYRSLLIAYSSDWRYPPDEMRKIGLALSENDKLYEFYELDSNFGHGAFMYDSEGGLRVIQQFMAAGERND